MYVVRVIDEPGEDSLHGIVRRVSDGTEQPFHGGEQLVELLRPERVPSREGP